MSILDFVVSRHWAVEGETLRRGLEIMDRHLRGDRLPADMVAEVRADRQERRAAIGRPFDTRAPEEGFIRTPEGDGAIIPIEGMISKYAGLVNGMSQPRGTTTDAIIASLRKAAADPAVRFGLLDIDSPGGTVTGTDDVAREIDRFSAAKPVVALAHDMMASAAYWMGSRADVVLVTRTAVAGSVGVYGVLEDTSAQLARAGVRVILVKAGEHKGIGVDGLPVTDAQVAVVQGEIDRVYDEFVRAALVEGRGMTEEVARHLADGRVHVGRENVTLGLADDVATYEEAVMVARDLSRRRAA